MRVEVRDSKGVLSVCPYHQQGIWACRHCDPENAPCVKACPRGAIYEITEGVLAIDPELCDGCGKCVEACPYNAIRLVDGKGMKCDLCLSFQSEPACVASGFARIVYSEREIDEMGRAIGWMVLEGGEYIVNVRRPRLWEARLVREVVERYEKLHGRFSWEEVLDGLEYELGEIPDDVKKSVLWWIRLTYEELGPLSFLDGEEIEEIAVIRLRDPIRVYVRGEGWKRTNLAFWTEEYFLSLVNRIAAGVGRRLTLKNPRVNAVLPDGSRLHAVVPPISSGHALTIRRFRRRISTPWDLVELRTATPQQLAYIWLAMDLGANVLIAGNTGSGKTTTLNALLAFVPLDERIILVEETPEIRIPHEHAIRLVPDEETTMQELVYDTLRMRPDRIVVGEVRRPPEIRALFDTMLAGQGKGSYATMHGRTVEETRRRILSMGIPQEDLLALDLIVVQRRRSMHGKEERKIVAVEGSLVEFGLSERESERELSARERFIRKNREHDFEKYVQAVSAWTR